MSLKIRALLIATGLLTYASGAAGEVSSRLAPHDPVHHTRIVMLGTAGGPLIRLKRAEPSVLLQVDNWSCLIDAGIGSLRNLYAAGVRASDVSAVFITHHHLDHDGGLADLIEQSSFERRSQAVEVVGPLGTKQQVNAAFGLLSPSRRIFASEGFVTPVPEDVFHAREITNRGVIFKNQFVTVTAVENSHFRFVSENRSALESDRSFSYRFDTPARSIVFTGDSGPSQALTDLATGADVLVSEVVDVPAVMQFALSQIPGVKAQSDSLRRHMEFEHLTPEEVGKMAVRARVKMVVLTHFSPGADDEADLRRYTDGVHTFFKGPVIAAQDLEEF